VNEQAPAEWGTGNAQSTEDLPPPAEVATGEEGETQMFQGRSKLFRLVKGDKPSWSELGVGPVRINVPIQTDNPDSSTPQKLPRIIMRRQGVLKLLLNAMIVPELSFERVGENMIRFACESYTEDNPKGEVASFLLKFGREEERNRMLDALSEIQTSLNESGQSDKS
jgi:hypothetical protein